jgi:RND family efflux transporter MFP subunit
MTRTAAARGTRRLAADAAQRHGRPWWPAPRRRPGRTTLVRLALTAAAGAAAAAAIAGVSACSKPATQETDTEDKVAVVTRPATRGTIRPVVVATGMVKPATGAELLVSAPQSARIAEMPKGVGDRVRKGDLLVRFDIPSLDADASERRSALASAEARVTTAHANEQRVQLLFQHGIAARKELEDAERERTDAEAAAAAARTARTAAGELAGRQVVRAPFAGVVAARGHNPGDLVDAAAAEPILRLVDPSRLQVEAAVPLADLARVVVGNPAMVTGPGAFPPERATVLSRPASVDPTTAAATVRLTFAAPTQLPAGTPVQIEIQGQPDAGAVLVPAAALVQEGTQSYLFAVDAQAKAHRRAVRVGIVAGGQAEILAGVAPGEAVVVSGQNALPDGATTTPAPPAPPAPPAEGEAPAAPAGAPDAKAAPAPPAPRAGSGGAGR